MRRDVGALGFCKSTADAKRATMWWEMMLEVAMARLAVMALVLFIQPLNRRLLSTIDCTFNLKSGRGIGYLDLCRPGIKDHWLVEELW